MYAMASFAFVVPSEMIQMKESVRNCWNLLNYSHYIKCHNLLLSFTAILHFVF